MCIDLLSDIGNTPYRYLIRGSRKREFFAERVCKTTAAVALLAPAAILVLGCSLAKTLFSCCDSPKPRNVKSVRSPGVVRVVPFQQPQGNVPYFPNRYGPVHEPLKPAFNPGPSQALKITPELLKREFSLLREQVERFIATEKEMEKCLQNLERPIFMQDLLDELDKQLLVLNNGETNNLPHDKENWSQDLWNVVDSLVEVSKATDRFLINYEAKSALIYRRPLAARQEFNRLHNAFCDAALEFWKHAKSLADLAHHGEVRQLALAKLWRWNKKY